MKTQKKNQKPIEIDAYLKYRCPNTKCGYTYWLSLKEAQTKNFRIVCDACEEIFRPKLIQELSIKYHKKIKPQVVETETVSDPPPETNNTPCISDRLLVLCSKTLTDYGFTKKEAYDLLKQSYILNQTDQPFELIQNTLKMIGSIDEPNIQTN